MNPGLGAARKAVLGGAVWQRCQYHLAQNAIHHAPNLAIRKAIGKELRRVWNAADGKAAEAELGHLVAAYRDSAPKLADWLETAIPEGLAVFALPERHQKRMRTSNPMERSIQQEIKRRTVKVRVFPNEASLELVTAILVEIDEKWETTDKPYEYPLRCVTLLLRTILILFQDTVDNTDERIELRADRRPRPDITRWHRIAQHLPDRARVDPKTTASRWLRPSIITAWRTRPYSSTRFIPHPSLQNAKGYR